MVNTRKCSYCNSIKIHFKTKRDTRQSLLYVVTVLFSKTKSKKTGKMEIGKQVNCDKCLRCYERMKSNPRIATTLSKSLIVLKASLIDFRTIFGNHDFAEWITNVTAVVKPDKNTLHIIFKIGKIRAYLDCYKVKGHFTIVTVERIL